MGMVGELLELLPCFGDNAFLNWLGGSEEGMRLLVGLVGYEP